MLNIDVFHKVGAAGATFISRQVDVNTNHQMECCDSPLKDNISVASTASISDSDSNSISDQSLSSHGLHPDVNYCLNVDKKPSIQNKAVKPIRRVTFATSIKVCLIPSRREFGTLSSFLWWTLSECRTFKSEAFVEVREHVAKYGCTVKEAMFTLYQPIHDDDDDNNNNINDTATSLQMDEEWLQSTLHSIFDKWNPVDFQSTSPSLPQSSSLPSLTSLCFNNSHQQYQHHQKQQQNHVFSDKLHYNDNSNVGLGKSGNNNFNSDDDDCNLDNVADKIDATIPTGMITNSSTAVAAEAASTHYLCGHNDHTSSQCRMNVIV